MKYLSSEWFAEANSALLDVVVADPCTLRTTVATDDQPIEYDLVLGAKSSCYDQDCEQPAADISFALSYENACSIAKGLINPKALFLAGSLKVGGDVERLSEIAPALAKVEDKLVELRLKTNY